MNEASALFGHGKTVEFEGVTYEVGPLTLEGEAEFGAWVHQRADEGALRSRAWLPDYVVQERMDGIARDVAAGMYAPGGKVYLKARLTADGVKQVFYLSLKPRPELAVVDRMYADLREKIEDMLHKMNTLPKAAKRRPGRGRR